jgi:hypothetical protein
VKSAAQRQIRRGSEPDSGRTRPFFTRPAGVQTRLRVGRSGDRFEREADAVADGVVHRRGRFAREAGFAGRLTSTVGRAEDEEARRTPMSIEAGTSIEEEVRTRPSDEEEIQEKSETSEKDEEVQARAEPEEEVRAQNEPEEEEVQARAEPEEKIQSRAEDEEVQQQTGAPDEELQQKAEEELQQQSASVDEEEVQARSAKPLRQAPDALASVERRLRASRGLGNPLPEETRRRMEASFGRELSGIRIHTDALAVELSRTLRAQAFTHGSDIYFNAGRFAPGTPEGDHLLAHELAHSVQQGAVKEQTVRLQPEDPDTIYVRPEALQAVRLARGEIGLVNAKITDAEGNRVGWERLHEYFRTAFGGDVIHPSVIRKITTVAKPGGGKQDAMPHWCGIFAWWSLKSAGVPLPDWKVGMNVLDVVKPRPPGSLPQKGDIAYRRKNDHFALVSGVESVAEAAGKPVKDVRVTTINGNTAGADNLGGQVQEITGPISDWLAFFDPMAKLPMPDVPLVATKRTADDIGPPPPETEAETEAAADPGPTDVAHLAETVPPTPEPMPAAASNVALEIPPPAPLPPPEPVAKVEALSLEGSSDEAMGSFVAAPASIVAATGPQLGAALDGKIVAEQAEAAEAAPELRAQTGGEAELGIIPPDQIPIPAGAEVGDGVQGETPADLVAVPHQDKAPPPTNEATEKLMDEQPEGGFLAWLRGAITNLMARIRTTDPGVSTSAGPRQQVALEGDADPERMARQKEEGAAQLREQRDTQVAAFRNHPGQSNIKPRQIDEVRTPEMRTEPATRVPPSAPGQDAADYVEAALPQEVRDKADADLAPVLEPGLKEAGSQTADAARTRDEDSAKEKEKAAAEARRISEGADAEQKRIVLDNRADVARQQGEGVKGAYEQVAQFSTDAAKEQTAQRKAIGDHVQSEEGKARKTLEDGEKEAETEKKNKEKEAADKKQELEKEQKKDSWWSRAARFVKKAVKAVTEAIDGIFTALRKAVATIIEKAKEAAVGLINRARNWVVDKLNRFRDWAKSQVDKYLKDRFPGLAAAINSGIDATVNLAVKGVNFVADTAIKGVEALADGLAAVLDKILEVYQTALKAAVQIAGAVLTGDFAEALRIAIQAACDIAGIDSKPIFDFIDRAGALITKILKAPLAFINNLMTAVGMGVRSFGENILDHLQKGLIAWLTGALSEAGVRLPERFDLVGIFSLVAQILGLTYANVKARIIKKFPAAATVFDLIERGFALVMKLKDLDFSGLWEEAKAALGNLQETVLGGIKNWVITTVIKEGIIWLLSLMNPASAIVKALKLLFDLVMWLVERFQQIRDFVLSVYDAVAKIAGGVLGPAAKAVEDALSRSLPVVISMVASLIGLGGIGKAVREVLEKITAPINKVIDTIIDKVVAFAKKIIAKVKSGAAKVKEKIVSFLWPKKKFSAGGGSHTLYFTDTGKPMIRTEPMALDSFIAAWEANAGGNMTAAKKQHLADAKATLGKMKTLAADIVALEKAHKPVPEARHQEMLQLQTQIATSLKGMLGDESDLAKTKERYKLEGLTGTFATIPKPKGDYLTGDHQPQAAVIKLLAARPYFQTKPGDPLRHRAAGGHADNAYVVNLQATRHAGGRTYGGKGTATKEAFAAAVQKMEKEEPSAPERRKKAVELLQKELAADVAEARKVYNSPETAPVWSDLDAFTTGDKKAKQTLVEQIRGQVNKGLTIMANQPMRELVG